MSSKVGFKTRDLEELTSAPVDCEGPIQSCDYCEQQSTHFCMLEDSSLYFLCTECYGKMQRGFEAGPLPDLTVNIPMEIWVVDGSKPIPANTELTPDGKLAFRPYKETNEQSTG